MTDRDAILRAVLEDPADDLPRLAYADALEEEGKVGAWQAGFIRQLMASPKLVARGRWEDDTLVEYRRGFVESVVIAPADFLDRAEELFSQHPITRVTLEGLEPRATSIVAYWAVVDSYDRDPGGHYVPRELFGLLHCGGRAGYAYAHYHADAADEGRQLALDDLSAACVAYGRRLAGLPPLSQPTTPSAPRPASSTPGGTGAAATP